MNHLAERIDLLLRVSGCAERIPNLARRETAQPSDTPVVRKKSAWLVSSSRVSDFRACGGGREPFLRKQLALFQERKTNGRRADDSTRWLMSFLSQWFDWRNALVLVKPETLIRWHRKGFRLFGGGSPDQPGGPVCRKTFRR